MKWFLCTGNSNILFQLSFMINLLYIFPLSSFFTFLMSISFPQNLGLFVQVSIDKQPGVWVNMISLNFVFCFLNCKLTFAFSRPWVTDICIKNLVGANKFPDAAPGRYRRCGCYWSVESKDFDTVSTAILLLSFLWAKHPPSPRMHYPLLPFKSMGSMQNIKYKQCLFRLRWHIRSNLTLFICC